jgi:hypothetical protein
MMRSVRTFALFLAISVTSAIGGVARAADLECGLSATGLIVVDGLVDDWRGVPATTLQDGAPKDASVQIRCNYDEEAIYLLVSVTDERLIRSKAAGGAEDRVVVSFAGTKLEVWPADTDRNVKAVTKWGGGKPPKWLTVVDSLQPKGFAVEFGFPLSRMPGGGKNARIVPFDVGFHDADLASENRVQSVLSTGGMLIFAEVAQMAQSFLEQNKLKPGELRLDLLADVDGEPGLERVMAGGTVIAVIGAELSYIALPVQKAKDVLDVRAIDLAGEGRSSLLARYVERGNGGSREVLVIWNMNADGSFNRTFAHEISKQLGKNRLTNRWELVPKKPPKGKKKAAGYELVIQVGDVVGFTQETWGETPAEDMQPILLPWDETKREVWRFRGDEYYGGAE